MSSAQTWVFGRPVHFALPALKPIAPLWFYAALGHFLLLAVCLVAGVVDERTFNGVSVWTKPAKFALSIGIYFLSLVWFAQYLSAETFHGRAGKALIGIPFIAGVLEMFYITLMAALGQASG